MYTKIEQHNSIERKGVVMAPRNVPSNRLALPVRNFSTFLALGTFRSAPVSKASKRQAGASTRESLWMQTLHKTNMSCARLQVNAGIDPTSTASPSTNKRETKSAFSRISRTLALPHPITRDHHVIPRIISRNIEGKSKEGVLSSLCINQVEPEV